MDTLKRAENAGQQLLDAIRSAQDSVASLAETVGAVIARRVPVLPLPEALQPPRARQVAESAFGFWQGLARAQAEFTFRLLDAFDPAAHRSKAARATKAA